MNKQDVVDEIAADTRLTKTQVDSVLNALGKLAQGHLVSAGTELTLPGIGKLKAALKAARTGRNPNTGEDIVIPARVTVKLVVAKALKDAVA